MGGSVAGFSIQCFNNIYVVVVVVGLAIHWIGINRTETETKVGRWDIRDQRKNRNRGKRKTRGNTYEVRKFDHPGPGYIALRHRRSLLTHAVLSHRHGHLLFVRVWEVGSSSGMIFFLRFVSKTILRRFFD